MERSSRMQFTTTSVMLGVPCCETSVFVGMQMPLHEHESALGRHITPRARGVDRESIHPGRGGSTFLLQTY